MQAFPQDWELIDKINYLQRKIILNSILYYEYNTNSISDHFYDDMCKQLVQYQHIFSRHNDIKTETLYGYVYYDFDGSTGFHLYNRLDILDKQYLLRMADLYFRNRERK